MAIDFDKAYVLIKLYWNDPSRKDLNWKDFCTETTCTETTRTETTRPEKTFSPIILVKWLQIMWLLAPISLPPLPNQEEDTETLVANVEMINQS